ncbi:MAG: methyltransferase [Anaerovoracaceae bacterium]|jgi:hypothetical protein
MKELGVYKQIAALPYLATYKKLIEGAIQMDMFSHMKEAISAEDLAARMGWDKANTKNVLEALTSIGFVAYEDGKFNNTEETDRYLVKDSAHYMGDVVHFFGSNQGLDAGDVARQVKEGGIVPEQKTKMEEAMDFAGYGEGMRKAQSGIRQTEILAIVRSLPESTRIKSILDLGCGAGMIGLSLLGDQEGRRGVLYDQPSMRPLIEETVAAGKAGDEVSIMTGDFMVDEIGSGYDLILASSIMLLAMGDQLKFMKKLYDALNPEGVVLCINEGIAPDYSEPWDMIMGYLPMKLQGMQGGVLKGAVRSSAEKIGFKVENKTLLLSTGTHDINILKK